MADAGKLPAVTSAPPALTADPQDPLPESNWFWRRVLVFAGEISRVVFIGWVLVALYDVRNLPLVSSEAIESMYRLAKMILLFGVFDRVLYLIAPSAEQAVKMLAASNLMQAGVHTFQRAIVTTPAGTAETTTTTGMPVEQRGTGQGDATGATPAPDTGKPQIASDGLPDEAPWHG